MRLSPLIPWWLTATVALAAGVALGGGLQQIRVANAQAALADARARHADTLRQIASQTAEAARLFRATEAEWRNRIDKETQDGQTRIDTARADALTARAAADSLRAQLDAYRRAAARAAAHPGAAGAGPSEPGADPLDLLAGLLARHSGELVEVGAFADELHARGLTCERASDALSRGAAGELLHNSGHGKALSDISAGESPTGTDPTQRGPVGRVLRKEAARRARRAACGSGRVLPGRRRPGKWSRAARARLLGCAAGGVTNRPWKRDHASTGCCEALTQHRPASPGGVKGIRPHRFGGGAFCRFQAYIVTLSLTTVCGHSFRASQLGTAGGRVSPCQRKAVVTVPSLTTPSTRYSSGAPRRTMSMPVSMP